MVCVQYSELRLPVTTSPALWAGYQKFHPHFSSWLQPYRESSYRMRTIITCSLYTFYGGACRVI